MDKDTREAVVLVGADDDRRKPASGVHLRRSRSLQGAAAEGSETSQKPFLVKQPWHCSGEIEEVSSLGAIKASQRHRPRLPREDIRLLFWRVHPEGRCSC